MRSIFLNSKKIEESNFDKKSFAEIYQEIMKNHASPDDVFSRIIVDGKNISEQEEEALLAKSQSDFETIEFDLKNKYDLAFEALDCSVDYIDNIISKIKDTVELFQSNTFESANLRFAETIESLELFVQLLSNVHFTLKQKYENALVTNKTFKQLEMHLLSIIKAIIPAKEKNDLVMLCDLLEYELVDNLTQWKITAIPELKSIQNNS